MNHMGKYDMNYTRESWLGRHWPTLMLGITTALVFVFAAVMAIRQHQDFVDRCRASGGVYHQERCQTTYVNQCNTFGTGTSSQTSCIMTPIESCDDVCTGGNPEQR